MRFGASYIRDFTVVFLCFVVVVWAMLVDSCDLFTLILQGHFTGTGGGGGGGGGGGAISIGVMAWMNELLHSTQKDVKNNAWVTVNNDFLVTSEVICQWFSRVTKSRGKFFGKSPHEWPQKSLFTVTNLLFYFLHTILYLGHTGPLRTIIDCSFRYCRWGRCFLT